jgi:hypothetical protein
LKQQGPWTYGALANHLWSVAGKSSRDDVNATFLQPFISYSTPQGVSYTLNAESTYNWESEEWSTPIAFNIAKVTKVGNQMIQYGGGVRYYASSAEGGPEGWALRFVTVLLFPK